MTTTTRRRTQKDRSESTQQELLEATLRCIERMGYSSISLNEVANEAGVSRGAITHHYGTKLDLAAAAINYFFDERYKRLMALLAEQQQLSLDERLDILAKEIDDLFPIGFEIIIAMRTDPDLQARRYAMIGDRDEEMAQGYERMFPEFAAAAAPRLVIGVVAAFFRGVAMEGLDGGQERRAEMNSIVKAMVRHYVAQELQKKRQ